MFRLGLRFTRRYYKTITGMTCETWGDLRLDSIVSWKKVEFFELRGAVESVFVPKYKENEISSISP